MKEVLAVAALGFSLAANIPYIIETIQGKTKPERISWLLWTMLGATYFASAVFSDGAVLFTAGELIGPVIVFILSFKFGVGGKSRFDLVSLAVALIAFALLLITQDVLLSLILALIVDGIGALLTIRKLHLDPSSESKGFWAMGAISSCLAILSLSVYNAETLMFPVYVILLSTYIFIKAKPAAKHRGAIGKL